MNLKHHFLLAMPGLAGDYFSDSLIYICEHTDEGALGLIVNRPTDVTLLELIASFGLQAERGWADVAVVEGGPVDAQRATVLHAQHPSLTTSTDIVPGVCLTGAMELFQAAASGSAPDQVIAALGYSGWGPGQLEDEIAANVWLTMPASTEILFDTPAPQKAAAAAATLGIDMRYLARPGRA